MKDKKEWGTYALLGAVVLCFLAFLYYLIWNIEGFFLYNIREFQSFTHIFKRPLRFETLIIYILIIAIIVIRIMLGAGEGFSNGRMVVAGNIELPRRHKNTIHGSARFATKKEIKRQFGTLKINDDDEKIKLLIAETEQEKEKIAERRKIVEDWEIRFDEVDKSEDENKEELLRKLYKEKQLLQQQWPENVFAICEFHEKIGGLPVLFEKNGNTTEATIIDKDRHSAMIGTTRIGKGRRIFLPTIGILAMAGENMLIPDPKGENYLYSKDALIRMGYQVLQLDFRQPKKSMRYNFLQLVIDAVDRGEMAEAINLCWDIASQLVGEATGEKIWTNGEASIIAGAIMAVVYDNRVPERKKYQNMTNVYFFIAESSKEIKEGKIKLEEYEENLSYDHPSKGLFAIAIAAPDRTLGSFTTSALTTLNLFTNPYIYQMTRESVFRFADMVRKKTAVFLILPDEKDTYHSLAALFVSMHYQYMVGQANRFGGKLPIRWNYLLEEFGSFPKIPAMSSMLTAGAGRGIRFLLVLQDFAQLDEKYGHDQAKTIRNNCENLIYLKTDDTDTVEALSKRLGTYTIYSPSKSKNLNKNLEVSGSTVSANFAPRELLKPEEIKRIESPYYLLFHRKLPFISTAPDLSEWVFNAIYGLGDEDYNKGVYMVRNFLRKEEMEEIKIEFDHPITKIKAGNTGKKGVKSFAGEAKVVKARTKAERDII